MLHLLEAVSNKRHELRAAIEALTDATKESFIKNSPRLPSHIVEGCKVVSDRYEIINLMPKGSICVEVGTQTGSFARYILDNVHPAELHLIDFDYSKFKYEAFGPNEPINYHNGYSHDILESFPDDYFDFIYIDASHSYENFSKDLKIAANKVKDRGFIICNDYTVWSPAEVEPYGILYGVNEFCADGKWDFVYFGLHGQGYHDVCLRKHVVC
jgi:hypothetical protein